MWGRKYSVNPNPGRRNPRLSTLQRVWQLQFMVLHYKFFSAIYCGTMSFVLFRRCIRIVCSGKSPSVAFSPFSSLPSSSSHFIPPLNTISDLLTKECGFSSSQVTTVMRRYPRLLRNKSDQTAREVIHLLRDSGFSESKLNNVILKSPCILVLRADRLLRPKMEFLKQLGLATQDIAHIVSRTPRLLSLSLETCLAPRVIHLETLFGSRAHLSKALTIAPELLTCDFEKQVIPRVEYLKNSIGIQEGSLVFARALGATISRTFETLEGKTKLLASLGFAEEEICQIVKGYPQALCISTQKLKESIDFLIHTAGLEPRIVASRPTILGYSIEKRLKSRYGVFKSLSARPHVKGLPSLVRFFCLSEQTYLKYIGQYTCNLSLTIIESPRANILEQ